MDINRRNFLKTTSITALGLTLPFPILTERKGKLYDSRGTLKSFKYMDVIEYRDGKFTKHLSRDYSRVIGAVDRRGDGTLYLKVIAKDGSGFNKKTYNIGYQTHEEWDKRAEVIKSRKSTGGGWWDDDEGPDEDGTY